MKDQALPPATIGLMSFNQVETIRSTFESLINQDFHGTLEILISDDGSTDGTSKILKDLIEAYSGRHSLRDISATHNVGLIGNVNRIFTQATHEFVFLAAGDDISHSNRVRTCMLEFARNPLAFAVHSKVIRINSSGQSLGEADAPCPRTIDKPEEVYASGGMIIGATAAYRKSLFSQFGPIRDERCYEDLVLAFRATLVGQLVYIPKSLVSYRIEGGLSSIRSFESKAIRDSDRLKGALRNVAFLEQRLHDVTHPTLVKNNQLIDKLKKEITYRALTAAFYQKRFRIWRRLFSKDWKLVLRVAAKEIPYRWSNKNISNTQ